MHREIKHAIRMRGCFEIRCGHKFRMLYVKLFLYHRIESLKFAFGMQRTLETKIIVQDSSRGGA